MSTTDTNYTTLLQEIQNSTSPTFVNFGLDKPRFIINTNTRQIEIPTEFSFLSVRYNHNAETIYFEIDRYFEGEDLSNHTCIVQFANKDSSKKQEGIYVVKEMDVDSYEDKIVFKWEVENDATQIVGDITFSIRFYTVDSEGHFTYSFNTLPATSNILDTLNTTSEYDKTNPSALEFCVSKITSLANSVLFTQQELTDEQKAQARANIGAKAEVEGNSTVKMVSYHYDGDQSAEHTFIKTGDGTICFVKVASLPDEGEVMLVGGSAFVRGAIEYFNFAIDITADMLNQTIDIDGAIIPAVTPNQITQIFYQGNRDSAPITYIIVCERPGKYKIAFETWYDEFSFTEAGIYVIDGRAYGKSVYVEDLNISIMIKSGNDVVNNPTDHLGNEIQMFNRGLCIGDSITEGVFDYSGANTVIRKYSYPTILSRMTGIDIVNAGISGLTSKTWYDASVDGDLQGGRWVNGEWVWSTNPNVNEGDVVSESLDCSGFDFAVIHLGINDTGTIGDDVTIEQAISTFETSINGIIANLKASSKGIKVFLATIIPYRSVNDTFEQFNAKIREIAEQTADVYLLDLTTYSDCYGDIYGHGYHLTALGYHKMASEISAYISYIIHENLEDFKWVQFIGTGVKY